MGVFRVVMICHNVPKAEGEEAAADIAAEFRDHRQHWLNVAVRFEEGTLVLQAESDFDTNGLALMDEFSDCISAYIATPFEGEIEITSVTQL